ncbi:hypothetical protein ATANTOWER_001340 [Ataeniobius toweri]|uniref:Uncharacterized protein n=1 Tax=Ataeniobius toweri TaxID=208326 RepID=A0ABU7BM12_9TELE|nr:hypothetical protein [Ataeniobius toweri]
MSPHGLEKKASGLQHRTPSCMHVQVTRATPPLLCRKGAEHALLCGSVHTWMTGPLHFPHLVARKPFPQHCSYTTTYVNRSDAQK